jgi:hypothetical protein
MNNSLDLTTTPLKGVHSDCMSVLWVFRDAHGNWCTREEGGATTGFATREAAIEFAQHLGRAWGAYRLFLELKDGRFTQELLNLNVR